MADGSIIIDTKIRTDGVEKGFKKIKDGAQSVATDAQKAANRINSAFSNMDISKSVSNAMLKVQDLEQQLSAVTSEFSLAIKDDDNRAAERLAAKRISLYDQLETARKKLAIEVEAAAKKEAAAEEKAAQRAAVAAEKEAARKERATRKQFNIATKAAVKFNARLRSIATSALVFSVIYTGLRKVTSYFGEAVKTNDEYMQSWSRLKGALLTAFQPIYEYALPAMITLMDVASKVMQAIGHIFASLGGKSDAQMVKNAQALYEQSKALDKVGDSAKKAAKGLASFDEITKVSQSGTTDASSETTTPDFSDFNTEEYKAKIDDLTTYVSLSLLALGAILTFSGANIPLGIGLLALGAVGLASEISTNWDGVKEALSGSVGAITAIISGAFLALGAILAFSGANIPLGIGLMAVGAIGLAATVAANWDTIKTALQGPIGGIVAIVSGALLALGAILAFSGASVPLGIGLMVAGAVGLATTAAVNWDTIKNALKGPVGEIVAIASGALLAIGAILAFSGASIPLGIGLMVVGAAGLAATAAVNWDTIQEALKGPIGEIVAIASGALLAIGIILACTGAALPLGIGLIAAGAAGLAATAAINWDSVKGPVKTVLTSILSIISGAGLVLGVLLCLTGAGIPLGLALIAAGLAGSVTAWKLDDNPVTRFVKNMANGVIGIINTIIDAINDLFHIQFKGLSIAGVELIPEINTRLLQVPKIPMLAKGAVIPPNDKFLAVLGDQPHGTNIEAPLATIQEAVALVMEEQFAGMMAGFEAVVRAIQEKDTTVELDGDVVGRSVNDYNRKMNIARGCL